MKITQIIIPLVCFTAGLIVRDAFITKQISTTETKVHVQSRPKTTNKVTPKINVKRSTAVNGQVFDEKIATHLPSESREYVKQTTRGALFRELIQHDPSYAAKLLLSMSPDEQEIYLYELVESWSSKEPLDAYKWLESYSDYLPVNTDRDYRMIALNKLASQDPEIAMSFLDRLESQELRDKLTMELASGWAQRDIDEALNFLKNLRSSNVSDEILSESYSTIMRQLAVNDPARAAEAVHKLPSGDLQIQLLDSVLDNLGKKDFEKALNWTLSLGSSESKDAGINLLIDRYGNENANHLFQTVIANQKYLEAATIERAFSRTINEDPQQASSQLKYIDEKAQAGAVKAIANDWLPKDQAQAIQWLSNLPQGSLYEAGAEQVTLYLSAREPASALKWAASLSDETTRKRLMSNIVNKVNVIELESILSAAQSLNLSAEEHARLFDKAERRVTQATTPLAIP